MTTMEFRAMGTSIVAVNATDEAGVRNWFSEVEKVCSRFISESELSRLNRAPVARVAVSPLLANVLTVAQRAKELTLGLVDVAVGGAVIEWGYDRSFEAVSDLPATPNAVTVPPWEVRAGTVSRLPGTILDLGGIAKGWTCDETVARGLAEVVSAGGDIRSSNPETVVEIEDPWGEVATRVRLGVGGLATSSTTRRRWNAGSEEAHHIIDPRTGAPAHTPVYNATVQASTAALAEAGAKAVLLQGADGLAWAEQQTWIDAAMVVWQDGNVYATTGWEMAA